MESSHGFISIVMLIPVLLTHVLLVLLALYGWFRWYNRRLLSLAADLPVTHKVWSILGHSYRLLKNGEDPSVFLLEISKAVVAKGLKTVCFWCGPLPLIMVHDIEDIQAILNSSNSIDKADEYEYFKVGLDSGENQGAVYSGLLTASGHVWRASRKHMNPLFHPRNLQHMIPVFNHNSRELVSCLSEHVGHGPCDLLPYAMDTALKTVCNLLFGPGVHIDRHSPDFRDLSSVVKTIPDLFATRLLRPWLRIEAVFRFLYRKELKKLNQLWNNFTNSRLEVVRIINSQKNGQTPSLADNTDKTTLNEPLNLVDAFTALQSDHPEFTDAGIHYEMVTFYCTGSDSMGIATSSCLLTLAQFPNMQERLYQEVNSVVGPDDDVTSQDLNQMPYLDQVVKETLRWFLIVPYILRKVKKDFKLSTCTIPANNTVVVSLVGIHTDPKIYPDPHKFDPDRFSNENTMLKERSTFVPFSGGPRNCIAKMYAIQSVKIMVVHVLRNYKLSTDMDIFNLKKKLKVTLGNAEGYNVRLQKRT